MATCFVIPRALTLPKKQQLLSGRLCGHLPMHSHAPASRSVKSLWLSAWPMQNHQDAEDWVTGMEFKSNYIYIYGWQFIWWDVDANPSGTSLSWRLCNYCNPFAILICLIMTLLGYPKAPCFVSLASLLQCKEQGQPHTGCSPLK